MPNFNDTNFDSSKLKRGSILYSAKLSPTEEGKYALFNAYNISWEGYKMYDQEFTYTGDVLSYIESQLDLKATADGEVWDNIKDNTITTQITIYTSSNSTTSPSIVWSGDTAGEYDNYTTYKSLPNGWARQIEDIPQAAPHVFMSTVYEVRKLDNTLVGYHDPHGTVIYLPGETGLNGNFKSTVFVRSSIHTPDTPANGANYNTGLPNELYAYINAAQHIDDNRISYNNGTEFKCWSDGIPAGNEALWATTAVITDTNPNDAAWTTPRQMTDTETYDVEFSNVNDPGNPTDNPDKWYDPVDDINNVDWSTMIWRAERVCANGIWGNWTIIRIKGEKGVKGDFVSTVFTRTNKNISSLDISETVTPGSYNEYDHPVPPPQTHEGETIVWTDGIPSGSGALWTANKTFSLDNENTEWSYPQLVADTDIYDVEFSPSSTKPDDPSTNPSNWIDPTTNHYKDYTEQNQHIYEGSWDDMIWRAERTKEPGEEWGNQTWVITKIKGEDGTIPQPMDYYQSRYALTDPTDGTELSNNQKLTNEGGDVNASSITKNGLNWNLTIGDATNKNIWQTSRRVTWSQSVNSWVPQYDSNENWEEPFMLNGLPGESQPIHPCLLYKWGADPKTSPTLTLPTMGNNSISADNGWKESPGAPSDSTNIFLWMIQGEYKIVSGNTRQYQKVSGEDYWTDPICLSGADGKPGADGDDIEFIYICPESTYPTQFDNIGSININSTNPANWYNTDSTHHNVASQYIPNRKEPLNNDYLGLSSILGVGWQDHPTGVDITHKYEYAAYRRTSKNANNQSYWEKFSAPFAWSIYGENGIDGDGVEYIYWATDDYPITEDSNYNSSLNPNNWNNSSAADANGHSFQDDDYLGPSNIYWTDEPSGVGEAPKKKYEYISRRKYNGETKTWGSFTEPKLWSNYAEDGLSINMVLETDNDNVTVGIDSDGLVNNNYPDVAHVYLKYNGQTVNTSNYSLSLEILNEQSELTQAGITLSSSGGVYKVLYNNDTDNPVVTLSNNTLNVSVLKELPLGLISNVLLMRLTAHTTTVIGDIPANSNFTRIFKITGIQLSIDDIYKLSFSTSTPHRNANNDGWNTVSLKLKSYTSDSYISDYATAKSKGFFIKYTATSKNTGNTDSTINILDDFSIDLEANFNKHQFILYYNSTVNSTTDHSQLLSKVGSSTWVDEEELSGVYDGTNGVDSRSEEYIYLLTDDIDFFNTHNSDYYNLSNWYDTGTDCNYQQDDFPFSDDSPTIAGIKYAVTVDSTQHSGSINTNEVIGIWTDNPQGVSEEYPYEFRAQRKYKTTNADGQRWLEFGKPICWANWGHTGEDGDGVEYIYYRCDSETQIFTDNNNPQNWVNNDNYQTSEYIADNTLNTEIWWADNPTGVDEDNKCEYVSTRKYRRNYVIQGYWNQTQDYTTIFTTNPNIRISEWKTSGTITNHKYNGSSTEPTENVNDEYTTVDYLFTLLKQLTNEYTTNVTNNGITSPYIITDNTDSENPVVYNRYFIGQDGAINHGDIWCLAALCAEYGDNNDKSDWSLGRARGSALTNGYRQIWTLMGSETNTNIVVTNQQNIINEIGRIYNIIYDLGFTINARYIDNKGPFIWVENNDNINQKRWSQYTYPKLWAKYGEQGPQGDPGGSGLVFDFTNDNLQLGVNAKQTSGVNNGKSSIKGDNFTYTMINLYSGDELIPYTEYKLTYTNNPIVVNGTHKLGYIFKHENINNTYYASLTKTTTVHSNYGVGDTSGWSNGYYFYIKTKDNDNLTDDKIYINDTQQIQFQITYNGKNYYKSVNVSTLHWGKDGEPAETFELFIPNSEIKIDAQGNTTPTSITPMVKHVRGGQMAEIISYSQLTTTYNTNGNFFAMGYLTNVLYTSTDQTNPIAPKSVTSGTSGDSDSSTRGDSVGDVEKGGGTAVDSGSSLDLEDPTQQGSKIDDEEVTEKINGRTTGTVTYIGNGVNSVILGENLSDLEWVKYSLWYTESGTPRLIDEEVTYAISGGVNGRDGKYIEYIYYRPEGSEQINWNATGAWNGATNPYAPNRNISNFNNRANPSYWTVTNQSDWISNSYKGTQNWTIWTDNPLGIDSTYQWEYISQRTYDGENWTRYSIPQAWSHYGESGKDGDGIEYIYHVSEVERPISNNTTSTDTIAAPNTYNKDIAAWNSFQQNEYGKNIVGWNHDEYNWTDDPTGVNENISYEYVSTRKYKTVTDDNKSEFGTLTNVVDIGSYVGKKLWFPFSEPTIWAKYGQRGAQGDPGTGTFELDWTNDQVNFGVDSTGKTNITYKNTDLQLVVTDSSSGLAISSISYDSYESTSTVNIVQTSNSANTPDGSIGYKINGQRVTIYVKNVTIPQSGVDIKFEVIVTKGSNSFTYYKTLRVFGQRNGQNGVSYELAISPNAISLASNGMLLNPTFNIGVIKYDGDTITNLTSDTLPENLSIQYSVGSTTVGSSSRKSASIGNNVTITASGSSDIVFYLVNNNGTNNTNSDDFDIDVETIPVVRDGSSGGTGPQGFTGPIVRMRGEYVHNKNTYYGNGEYKKNTGAPQYDGTSPLYKDIVTYTWANGKTKYYTPKYNITGSYITASMPNSYLCTGSSYVHYQYPATSGGTTNSMWVDATQYEFVATRLLYADQGLVNQLSTHDLIVTNSEGYPVAGLTSGRAAMTDANGTTINSPLTQNLGTSWSGNTVNNDDTDPVRIFAGEIKNGNNYSLTNAPFRVTQSGVAYMDAAYVQGNITANTLSLGDGSFAYIYNHNDDQSHVVTLPELDGTTTKTFYILSTYATADWRYRIRCKNNYYTSSTPDVVGEDMYISVGTGTTVQNSSGYSKTPKTNYYRYICPKANTFYQCVSVGKTWNIIITEITGVAPEYRYIDVTNDVGLYGYKYDSTNKKFMICPYNNETNSDDGWGPLMSDNTSQVVIEFYTFLDPEIYGDNNNSEYALADFSSFMWVNESTT